jgi:NAD(P)-dependent dehydrogenase (short-subunit alcohol dehydrogenase family)
MGTSTIATLRLGPETLQGKTVVVTGAGGGIGYEAARSLLCLGANVVIAEIDVAGGRQAAEHLGEEFSPGQVLFAQCDVGDEVSVQALHRTSVQRFGKVDAVLNNATIAPLGAVKDVPIEQWDASYRVNLRGPVLMAQAFLPDMISRGQGSFVCVSSTGTAYLGGYETFKAAQVHLANTLDAELEGTGVIAFTIGPGLVPTQTASRAVAQLAPLLGMTVDEFFVQNKNSVLTPEEAGAGFAVAIAHAEQFRGMEISSLQALKAVDINFGSATEAPSANVAADRRAESLALCRRVRTTLEEQAEGWKGRSLFERQWVIRDFRKTAGSSAEEWLAALASLEKALQGEGEVACPPLDKLASYYDHLAELAKGYEKDPAKLAQDLRHVYGWRDEVNSLAALIM